MFTALWSASTMPVKMAAVRATGTELTPILSTCRRTSRQ
jgi:hypothetical protein